MFFHWLSTVVLVSALVACALVAYSPISPEPLELPSLPTLEANSRLQHAEHLFQGDWVGPEALALDPSKKLLYTGLADGRIVRWDGKSSNYEVFARTGEVLPNCGAHEVEHRCGRPLGLHFNGSGHLFVADAYKGVLSINPEGKITTLTTSVEGKPFRWVNDLAVADDGTIYFTDSSIYERRDFLLELLETKGRGRLLAYYPSNGTTEVLLRDLYFANGMTLSHDKKSVLFAELNKVRISRYYPASGKFEVFADNLPGTPDNIRLREHDGKLTYLIGMGLKRSSPFSLLQTAGPLPSMRAILAYLPSWMLMGVMTPWGLITELDQDGQIVNTYQDPTGNTAWLSEALDWEGYLYLGSLLNPYLGRVALK